ncbi:hypothetical protein HRI_000363100 [Hibiscus trionum]|uniref:C2H2-type domain-containing protein n=1 Tax=Hibiscus trionum TaxID=183268 RepID=A0A9W7GYG1_HIBTR|nr:hypothetical protein HRI_000363100 [Hibiscus trionum]
MALIVDRQSEFKYFCEICNKRFGCGRALGGHMRSHGIGDESRYVDNDDTASDWEDGLGGNVVSPSKKRMYELRTSPDRLKRCRVCENCGMELFSWKSYLEHGKCCSSKDAESFGSSQGADGDDDDVTRRGSGYLYKRKRSMVSGCPSSEEEDVANCLMMLSNATVVVPFLTEPEESCALPSVHMDKAKGVAKGLFECKACKKVFNSHQALGGHRASHKKVKGCFAARLDNDHNGKDDGLADEDRDEFFLTKPTFRVDTLASTSKKKSKVHECSICHRVFSSGQALGGHKRCHWITSNPPVDHISSSIKQIQQTQRSRVVGDSEQLDLNLPAPTNELVRRNYINRSSFDVPTRIYLQPWIGMNGKEKEDNLQQPQVDNNNSNDTIKNNICNISKQDEEDKTGSTMMLAKLSELKDINMSGSSFPWLQVGIVSTANVCSDP